MENHKLWYRSGQWLFARLPVGVRRKWLCRVEEIYRGQILQSEKAIQKRAEDHIISQLTLIMYGSLFCLILWGTMILLTKLSSDSAISISRNAYGSGSKTVTLQLEKEGKRQEYLFEVAEQTLAKEELDKLYHDFFKEIEVRMKGDNPSLSQVTKPLNLPVSLEGYPFKIEYEFKDYRYIDYQGQLTEEAKKCKEDRLTTSITVVASYGEEERKKEYQIVIHRAKPKRKTVFDRLEEKLKNKEKESRQDNTVEVPGQIDGISITEAGADSSSGLWILLLTTGLGAIVLRRYYKIKEETAKVYESAAQDFTTIVHLLSLYMGAGLSFSRAVGRISRDYKKGNLRHYGEQRFAFEQLSLLDRQIQMGASQKDACERWGQRMQQDNYRRLSLLIVQCLSKGSREVRIYMKQMEQDAFRDYIDCAKKRGEEASSKMIFPLILLMAAVMVIVMFPAIIQFSNY